jgi:hypothetical protein
MVDMVVVKGKVTEDGQLIIELPSDTPHGDVEVVVRKIAPAVTLELTPEEEAYWDTEFEALINDPKTFTGLGLTAEEIAKSPEIGIWQDREDMADPVAYLAEMRRKSRERRLKRED